MISKTFISVIVVIMTLAFIYSCSKDETPTTTTTPTNQAPNSPSNPKPADGAVNVPRFVVLVWTCTDPNAGDTLRYDVVAGTTNPPVNVVATNTLANSVDLGLMAANITVYWKVTAKDNSSVFTEGPVWSFTTGN